MEWIALVLAQDGVKVKCLYRIQSYCMVLSVAAIKALISMLYTPLLSFLEVQLLSLANLLSLSRLCVRYNTIEATCVTHSFSISLSVSHSLTIPDSGLLTSTTTIMNIMIHNYHDS
jgi:hypothetical protein